jgi:hypothetical protein
MAEAKFVCFLLINIRTAGDKVDGLNSQSAPSNLASGLILACYDIAVDLLRERRRASPSKEFSTPSATRTR